MQILSAQRIACPLYGGLSSISSINKENVMGGKKNISHWLARSAPSLPRLIIRATTNTENMEADTPPMPKPERANPDWEKAMSMKSSGILHKGKVEACNNGGLLVRFGSLKGFLPFSQMVSSRFQKDEGKGVVEIGKEFVGESILVKVIEANEEEKKLIFSEKQAAWLQSVEKIKEGDIFEGTVNCVTEYGAFVDLKNPNGAYPVSGLVHVSELSWDVVHNPRDVIEEGQTVSVKVISMDLERMRLSLSIKQMQFDPLFETLETLMNKEDNSALNFFDSEGEISAEALPGLEDICKELLKEEGISAATLGRQASEKRVVSQDLQLWLSNAPVEDGKFTLLARAGRQVQEVNLTTTLDKEAIKTAVQRVTGRVP